MQAPLAIVSEGQTVLLKDRGETHTATVLRVAQQYRGPLTAIDVQVAGESGTRTNIVAESARNGSLTYWCFAPAALVPPTPTVVAPTRAVAIADTAAERAEDAVIRAELAAGIDAIPSVEVSPRKATRRR